MKKLYLVAALLAAAPSVVMAHHGTATQFDTDKLVEVSGVVTEMAFVNPHSYVYFDVTDANGKVTNWHCEMRASSVLKRSGWTEEMFAPGTHIDINGVASRKEPNGCYVETISINNGPAIERYAQLDDTTVGSVEGRPAKTAWGDPNLDGDWAANQRLVGAISGPAAAAGPGPRPGGGRGGVELTAAGEAYKAANIAPDDTVTGRLDCNPRDFFSDWTFDQPANRIIQTKDTIVLKYGFMDTERTIHMNMASHPANIAPSWAGHSIGKWENGVLVVDTVGFNRFTGSRTTRSEQFHAVERFTLDPQAGSITRTYMGEDPLFWVGQQTGEDVVYLSDYPWELYNCDDRTVE